MKTTVVNKSQAPYDVFIGRAYGTQNFGNPFTVKAHGREKAIEAYIMWLIGIVPDIEPERRAWILAHIPGLKGRVLGCYCAPLPCHGDVLATLADGGVIEYKGEKWTLKDIVGQKKNRLDDECDRCADLVNGFCAAQDRLYPCWRGYRGANRTWS